MILIGITGAIGHGKTTLAKAFTKVEPDSVELETSYLVMEVANALIATTKAIPSPDEISSINDWLSSMPAIVKSVLHADCSTDAILIDSQSAQNQPQQYEKLFVFLNLLRKRPILARQSIDISNKQQYRALLQWLGSYLIVKVDAGIWYNELIRRLDVSNTALGIIGGVRYTNDADIIRRNHGFVIQVVRPSEPEVDINDPTESERKLIKPDATVENNGTVDDLALCAQKILEDIKTRKLAKNYSSKTL